MKRVYCINENENGRDSLFNRRWFFHGDEKNGCSGGGIELRFFSTKNHYFLWSLEFSKFYSEEYTIHFSFTLPFLIWFSFSWHIPWLENKEWYSRWVGEDKTEVEAFWGKGINSFAQNRKFEIRIFQEYIGISLFALEEYGGSSSKNKKWQEISFDWVSFLLGKIKVSKQMLRQEKVLVPLPEKEYEANCIIYNVSHKRPRWFRKNYYRGEIKCKEGIPVPGKGTESYNCEGDFSYSISTYLGNKNLSIEKSVSKMIGEMVSNVDYKRRRYPI